MFLITYMSLIACVIFDVILLIIFHFLCLCRLRELSNHLNHGEVPMDVLQKTVGYAVSVLEAIYIDETK